MNKENNEVGKTKQTDGFFIVPSRVFDLKLNPYELAVLFYLMMRADNKTHTCFPSEVGIANACGMGKTSVFKHLKSLSEKGIIKKEKKFQKSRNGLMRQTSNKYLIKLYVCDLSDIDNVTASDDESSLRDRGDVATRYPPYRQTIPPISPRDREINKTIPNITKSNITIPTELSAEQAAEADSERFSFLELKRECFEGLRKENRLDDEYIALIERGLEHLWFKKDASYEGRKYAQNELHSLLVEKTTPEILARSVQYLNAAGASVRSPVPYLAKCILGLLINGLPQSISSDFSFPVEEKLKNQNDVGQSSFDLDDFFSAAMQGTYPDLI